MQKHFFQNELYFPEALNLFQLWHTVVPFVYEDILQQMATERIWQLFENEMWVGDQLWHCSNLKTEHKDKLAKKAPVHKSLLFLPYTQAEAAHATTTTHRRRRPCLSASGVILCLSVKVMFRPAVWEEREGHMSDSLNTQTNKHTHTHIQLNSQKDAGEASLCAHSSSSL